MPKITNDGLTRSGTGCFIAVPIWQQWASKGWNVCGWAGVHWMPRGTLRAQLDSVPAGLSQSIQCSRPGLLLLLIDTGEVSTSVVSLASPSSRLSAASASYQRQHNITQQKQLKSDKFFMGQAISELQGVTEVRCHTIPNISEHTPP